ncbi:MAG: polymer-forming cytoskeletal protein [Candidatus Eisenbacteria sp.]|nr:polymer-forming cytoskeletal protein [Candidatus Eisenbacteria bacterium]
MFKKSSPRPAAPTPKIERAERREQSFLQSGAKLDGDLTVEGDLRVEGQALGRLGVTGLLTIGPRAEIDGALGGREIIVHGKVRGTIQAEERIHLARGAKVACDLYCKALIIEDGVFFHGRSHMGEPIPRFAEAGSGGKVTAKESGAIAASGGGAGTGSAPAPLAASGTQERGPDPHRQGSAPGDPGRPAPSSSGMVPTTAHTGVASGPAVRSTSPASPPRPDSSAGRPTGPSANRDRR